MERPSRVGFEQNTGSAGNLAVTVSYSDGTEIQILPAIRTNSGGVRIANPGSNQWSNVARPDDFAKKLAKVNTVRDGRVVPIGKLDSLAKSLCRSN